jgi:hypothetical protein
MHMITTETICAKTRECDLDMLLVELHQVECEEDLTDLSFNTTSIAEFQGRWFLGLWAGRFINVRRITTPQVEADA